MIWADGTVVQTRCLDEVWYHNSKNNSSSIGIALLWNLNKEKPTKEQYEALNVLLWVLTQVFTGAEVKPHWWWKATCPWKYFDKNMVMQFLPMLVKNNKNPLLGTYNITRYYSPITWQTHYYKNKTYEQDVTMNCWASNIGNDWCMYPANWVKLTEKDSLKVVACPWQFPLGTRFEIESYGRVKCIDRGSAIQWRRLDLWAWYWDAWLFRIETQKRPAWDVNVINIDFSNVKK